MQIRLAFAGQMRSGKDTAAEYVVRQLGAKNMKFADPIYDILHYAQDRCGVERHKDRFFLQWLGTDWARNTLDPQIWINILLRDIKKQKGHIVVSDARFSNEFEALKRAGFKLIKIDREEELRAQFHETGHTSEFETHSSEWDVTMYQDFDMVIHNNGSLEDLYAKMDELITQQHEVSA